VLSRVTALGEYLRRVIPGGLGSGSVDYRVESVTWISRDVALVVVEQVYVNENGWPRDSHASHTHSYVLAFDGADCLIAAGQNTIRVDT
jgi:hypothetical protein